MQPTYNPKAIESRWYEVWEDAGAFRPEIRPDGEPFTISIPPPNVTGVLHMGHALNGSIQDLIIRRKRMQGYAALWVPGMDHAGIATQNVVERELEVEGLSRTSIGRAKFEERAWAWKESRGGQIIRQLRTMGFSCDWTRERFTLDEGLSAAVREVFVTLYEQGLIYRGLRIINWCPYCATALSDIEVEHEDEVGVLAELVYPLEDGSGTITVATTRPETMLGDTAVAVHPDDERYARMVGKMVRLPLVGRLIPIVADSAVDREFGTGAVKVTPAHDPLDYEIGQRHDLESIVVIGTDAKITDAGGRFAGMDRLVARPAVLEALSEIDAVGTVEEHLHSVGHCSRSGDVIEPLLSTQWFVKTQPLARPAIDLVESGAAEFSPRRWENNYFRWMEGIRDWCISRQLWWGHRIPAWYCNDCGDTIVSRTDVVECECGGSVTPDEDVLDTWFSSALWPFSTLGWPEETSDLQRFYPTSVLVTGPDIIFFWVARMLMMGIKFTGEKPFTDIVIHGLVRTEDGAKMSKSSGNVIDPLDFIERYGADAVRLSLLQAAAPGHDIPLDEAWVEAARKFGNKLWNGVRFVTMQLDGASVPANGGYPVNPTGPDAWILTRLHDVIAEYDTLLDRYRFSDAIGLLYTFVWSEVFDWYLELSKAMLRDPERAETTKQTLGVVIRDVLKVFHPVIPYVTEELWSEITGDGLLIVADWPAPPKVADPVSITVFQDLVSEIRRFRSEHSISPRKPFVANMVDDGAVAADWWSEQFNSLVNTDVSLGAPDTLVGHAHISAGGVDLYVVMEGLVDIEVERPRIEKAIQDAQSQLQRCTEKLDNANFRDLAPADIVAKEQAKLVEFGQLLAKLDHQLEQLG
ncbi:MAG: valine--tRNA ligase [Acidobacteria bacterium]|nr:valine--tRNA ligase [Acidobacteriota bacterium]